MIWHSSDINSVVAELNSNIETGLSTKEAEARHKHINQKIKEKEDKFSIINQFVDEIKSPIYYFLFGAAILTLLLHWVFGILTVFEPITLMILGIVKAIFSCAINYFCERSISKTTLKQTSTITCLRDGEVKKINSSNIVPGDIIYVESGNYIAADARLISVNSLHCDEFAISGDSVSISKNASSLPDEIAPIQDRNNMVYAGTHVVSGSGVAVVTEILDYTEYGKIKKIENENVEQYLPVEDRFTQLSKILNTVLLGVLGVAFIVSIICNLVAKVYPEHSFINSFMNSALLVSSILLAFTPNFIKSIAKLSLCFGLIKMKKRGIEVYNPQTVAKIAQTNLICADKTGTLTQNKMVLTRIYNGVNEINVATDTVDGDYKMILRIAALCCDGDVKLVNGISEHYGDPTQTAIIAASMEHLGLGKYDLENIYPRMATVPFDPGYKLMSTLNVIDGKNYVIVRGTVDELIPKCINNCERFCEWEKEMSLDGLRVVGVAMKQVDETVSELSYDFNESGLNFIGLLGISDMPRVDSRKAVIACKKAGIKVIMFTGDSKSSAFSFAQKMKIASSEEHILTGTELDALSDGELLQNIDKFSVFSGIDSKQRERIITTFKTLEYRVAVTGDDSTNTESLRVANVGYSMGKAGTDSTICESEVVIDDDSFGTVVESIKSCRGIYNCIAKAVKFFFSASLGTIASIIVGNIIYGTSVITNCEIMLFWLFSIVLTTIALTAEAFSKRDINTKIDNDFGIFNSKTLFDVLFNAAIYLISALVSYSIALNTTISPSSFTFCSLILTVIATSLVFRRKGGMISFSTSNRVFCASVGVQVLLIIILSIVGLGKFVPFSILYWLYLVIINFVVMLVSLGIKLIRK